MGAQVRPLQTGIGLETYGWREILRMRIGSRSTLLAHSVPYLVRGLEWREVCALGVP